MLLNGVLRDYISNSFSVILCDTLSFDRQKEKSKQDSNYVCLLVFSGNPASLNNILTRVIYV